MHVLCDEPLHFFFRQTDNMFIRNFKSTFYQFVQNLQMQRTDYNLTRNPQPIFWKDLRQCVLPNHTVSFLMG